MVRKARLELARLAAQEPKSCASTNSATFAGPNAAAEYISGPPKASLLLRASALRTSFDAPMRSKSPAGQRHPETRLTY